MAEPRPSDAALKPIVPNPGSELDPANFVGRRAETDRALEMLKAGQNIVLSDPRRMGKTFWTVALANQMSQGSQFQPVRIDYQGVQTTQEFLLRSVEHLAKTRHLPHRFVRYLRTWFNNVEVTVSQRPVTIKKVAEAIDPLVLLERLLQQLGQSVDKVKKPTLVIIMDEVPDAVLSIAEHGQVADGKNLLKRLRYLRGANPAIRWIVAGSVGFHHVWNRCGAGGDVINDLNPLGFGPLDPTEAATLTRRLALGIARQIEDEAVTAMVKVTGGMPWLIQKLSDALRYGQNNVRLSQEITAQEVGERFSAFIADRDQSHDVTHFVTRITQYYPKDEAKLAYSILDWAAQEDAGWRELADLPAALGQHERFQAVIDNLVNDHYLSPSEDGQRVRWRYDFIRSIYHQRRWLGRDQ